jgi:predicted enzyme related to lactoylglutathione lyase
MFQGLRTVIYRVKSEDLKKAKLWYSKLLGQKPYFDEPFYVGFSVGGYELGLDPTDEPVVQGNNVHTYWGVKDIQSAMNHCLATEAAIDSDIRDVGGDIKVATVRDPFGNILGLIQNPHFKAADPTPV